VALCFRIFCVASGRRVVAALLCGLVSVGTQTRGFVHRGYRAAREILRGSGNFGRVVEWGV
jgi:hypothetical protein